jgi:hypothetical protein
MAFLNFHNTLLHLEIEKNEGKVIKTVGDAFMADFPSAVNAVKCAVSIQQRFQEHNQTTGTSWQLRIGIHVGDVVISNNDIFGDGVNIASRLQAIADPGGICVSEDVYHHIKNHLEYKVVHLGAKELKNVSRKVITYKIIPDAIGKHKTPGKSRKGMTAFLLLLLLGALGAAYYYVPMDEDKALLSNLLALVMPTPTPLPTPVPTPTVAIAPTSTRSATPTSTATRVFTPTPTITPKPKPVKKKPVPKHKKVIIPLAPTPTPVPKKAELVATVVVSDEAVPTLNALPTMASDLAPTPTETEMPLPPP